MTTEYSKDVDVFVTEFQTDTARIITAKYGLPSWLDDYTVDTHHTPHYAVGYMMKEVNPRLGMVTHIEYEEDLLNEVSAGVRAHYDGLFLYGAPGVVVVNVTGEAIWARKAAQPGMSGANVPHPRQLLGLGDGPLPDEVPLPQPRLPREQQQEQYTRDNEIDPHKYYPPDVYREPTTKLPADLSFSKDDLEGMIAARPDSDE